MWPTTTDFPGGTVGIPCGTVPRYLDFEHSLEGLRVPFGTHSLRMPGSNVTLNTEALADQMSGEWLWLMGDDHTFEPDILLKLLAHEVDVVVPLCVRRGPPFLSVLYKELDAPKGICETYQWEELHKLAGLIPIRGAGTAGMLIRRHVLEAIPKPRFKNIEVVVGLTAGEDVSFSHRVNEAGLTIWADLDTVMGHIAPVDLRPVRGKEGWYTEGVFGRRSSPKGVRDMRVRMLLPPEDAD